MKFFKLLITGLFISTLLFASNLHAQVESNGNAVDDTEFTPGIDEVSPAGYVFDDTAPDSIDEDDVGAGRMSANRNQYMTIRDAAGNERGVNVTGANEMSVNCANCTGSGVSHIDDAVFTATTDDIAPMGALFDASPPSITDGNAGIPRMSDLRYLIVDLTELDGNAITLNEGTSEAGTLRITIATDDVLNVVCDSGCAGGAQFAVDDPLGATPTGTLSLGRRDAVLSALTPIDDDAVAIHIDGFGSLWSALTADDGARIPADSTAGLKVDLGVDNDVVVTNAGTFVVQEDGAALTALQLIDNIVSGTGANISQMNGVAVTMGNGVSGTGVQRVTIASDTTGVLSVDDNGANLSIDWGGTVPPIGAGTEAAALRVTVATDSTGVLSIDDNGGTLTVDSGAVFTVQEDGDALTALQLIDNAVSGAGFNITQQGGVAITLNTGAVTTGTQRITIATDDVLNVVCDSGCAGGAQFAVDDALGATPTGTLSLARRDAVLSALTPVDDDAVALHVDGFGSLWGALSADNGARIPADATAGLKVDLGADNDVVVTNAGTFVVQEDGAALTALQIMDDWDETNRAAVNTIAGQVGVQGASGVVTALTQRVVLATDIALPAGDNNIGNVDIITLPDEGQQTAANSISVTPDTDNDSIGTTGVAPPGEAIFIGGLSSGATGGFLEGITVCGDHFNIDITTATTTLAVTGVAGRHVRICSINVVTNAANNIAFIAGTGATCGTSTAGMTGGTTAAEGWNFASKGGITQGMGFGEIMSTNISGGATGDSVCIVTSAGTQLSGQFSYAIH